MATKKTAKRRIRTFLDRAILEVLARVPKPYDHDEIARIVEAELPTGLRATLTPGPDVALHRRITKRIRALLRHADRRLARLQDHYPTATGMWVSLDEMKKSLETAMWNLDQIDLRRRKANADYVALRGWIADNFPDAFAKDDKDTGDLFDKERA